MKLFRSYNSDRGFDRLTRVDSDSFFIFFLIDFSDRGFDRLTRVDSDSFFIFFLIDFFSISFFNI